MILINIFYNIIYYTSISKYVIITYMIYIYYIYMFAHCWQSLASFLWFLYVEKNEHWREHIMCAIELVSLLVKLVKKAY